VPLEFLAFDLLLWRAHGGGCYAPLEAAIALIRSKQKGQVANGG
jgi:hypothetical protein